MSWVVQTLPIGKAMAGDRDSLTSCGIQTLNPLEIARSRRASPDRAQADQLARPLPAAAWGRFWRE